MLVLRLLLVLSALSIIISGGMYLLTNNPRYLMLAWKIARFIFFAILIFALLFVLERYVLIGWRILI